MIEIENLNKSYDRTVLKDRRVLKDISLTLPDTGFVCILGPSGCGKTSLLNAIGGLDRFDSGTISTGKVKVKRYGNALFEAERNQNFGYIFQNYYLLSEHSVAYNVYLGLHSLKLSHDEKIQRTEDALKAVEMERYYHRNVGELSGGQQQRVAIARALARKPRVIFADEPTGNLDEANTRNICGLLRRISRTSLVVMVTHEEHIARFFADRIVRLDNGQIASDDNSFQRGDLSDSKTLYTGDYRQIRLEEGGVKLRYYQQEGSPSLDISIVSLRDKVIIKLSDDRVITCGAPGESPVLVEGERPRLTLEHLEKEDDGLSWNHRDNEPARAGTGVKLRDMIAQARHMNRAKGLRRLGTRLFLVLLTILSVLCVADYITVSSIDPEDFITTHSQILEVRLERGPKAGSQTVGIQTLSSEFKSYLEDCGLEYTYVPNIKALPSVNGSTIYQLEKLAVGLNRFSYTPLAFLDETSLIMGRMPENSSEVVVDRWVLDEVLDEDSVARNGITDISYFLGKQMNYDDSPLDPTIVGICDSGEPAVYCKDEMFVILGTGGANVATLSDLQAKYPGVYDNIVLSPDECIVFPENAGLRYYNRLYSSFAVNPGCSYTIMHIGYETDFYASIVVADDQLDDIMLSMSMQTFYVFCDDKAAMTDYLNSIPAKMGDTAMVTVIDSHGQKLAEYQEASALRLDGRTIVILTVMVLSMIMLYLLRRSQIQEQIGMLSVYRLLGIPKRKIVLIFWIESAISTLTTALPAAALTWAVVFFLGWLPDIGLALLLPWQAALGVYGAVTVFHLIVSTLPLYSLLKLPPAQLAAKYDF